jgi:hypothetical protein
MSSASSITQQTIRKPKMLRLVLSLMLLCALVAAAASYSHGSRYALVTGHPKFSSTVAHPATVPAPTAQRASALDGNGPHGGLVASNAGPVRAVRAATQPRDSASTQERGGERCPAPRGNPASLRGGVLDPPALHAAQQHTVFLESMSPPVSSEPHPRASASIELCISLT